MSKQKYIAVIFDMDGTIVDTERVWKNASLELLRHYGVSYPEKIFQIIHPKIHGLSAHKSCQIIKDEAQLSQPLEAIIKKKIQMAYDGYKTGVAFIDGFQDFHAHITRHGLKSGIATNADAYGVSLVDNLLSLHTFFGAHMYDVTCVDMVCKPDPAIYLYAARKLVVDPTLCIAIEDSAHGIAAAKKAGMYCIGINSGGDRSVLSQSDYAADTYAEITDHIQALLVSAR